MQPPTCEKLPPLKCEKLPHPDCQLSENGHQITFSLKPFKSKTNLLIQKENIKYDYNLIQFWTILFF